jgi:hypothetical protein
MKHLRQSVFCIGFFCGFIAQAQLAVTVSLPKVTGNKAVVALGLKNSFSQSVESARATVILLDAKGKMVGQSAKWVIGGTEDKPGLAAGGTNTFNFVITAAHPLTTTNLTARLQFSG